MSDQRQRAPATTNSNSAGPAVLRSRRRREPAVEPDGRAPITRNDLLVAPVFARLVGAKVADASRLAAVDRSGLVATGPEEAFDRLVRLAATVLEAPLAFVTIVDDTRSWYKSCVGLPEGSDRFGPVETSFCQYVIGLDDAVVIDDTHLDARWCTNPAIETIGVAAWAGYPVRAPGGEILGTFCVVDTAARHWSDRDIEILDTLAHAAAGEIALRSALVEADRLTRRTAEFARTLQQSLLPPELPDVPGFDIGANYVPASSGEDVVGDFYDVFEGVSRSWCVAVGDVCGKGPQAASLTGLARWTLRAVALRTISPAKVLCRLNGVLLHQRPGDDRHVTVAMATIRRHLGQVTATVCAAGHPLPLLRRADGTVCDAARPGMAAGWFGKLDVTETKHDLYPGDALVFVTDGVLEARGCDLSGPHSREEFGPERLRAVVAAGADTAVELAARIMDAVEEFRDGPPRDDTAVVVVQVTHPARPCVPSPAAKPAAAPSLRCNRD